MVSHLQCEMYMGIHKQMNNTYYMHYTIQILCINIYTIILKYALTEWHACILA